MQVYDKVIEKTRELLKPFPAKELNRNHAKSWNLLKENEFLLQKEVAFELGIRSQPSTCYQAVTSSKELISEDQILLYGPDLPEIKKSVPFTRITWIQIDPIEDQDKAYQRIKKLEFAKFKIIPEGYMMLSSSMDQKEQVRVSKKAVKKGLDFATVGNLMIQRYKEEFQVKHVQILFITRELPVIGQLMEQGKKVDEITNAFDPYEAQAPYPESLPQALYTFCLHEASSGYSPLRKAPDEAHKYKDPHLFCNYMHGMHIP